MKGHWFLVILIIIILGLILFEPIFGWRTARFFSRFDDGGGQYRDLILENQAIKAEIAELESVKDQLPESSTGIIRAMVFTRYPFNLKDRLLVDAGTDKGVEVGQAVLVFNQSTTSTSRVRSEGVLMGKIDKVFDHSATIETIFDKGWQSSVRVGKKGYIALLKGGNEPKATLIPKDAVVNPGDIVYSVDPDLPNSTAVGEVQNIGQTSDQVFQEATLRLAYDFNSVVIVGILK